MDSSETRVLSCRNCQGPVMSDADSCAACGTPVTGKEFPYVVQRPAGPDIPGMLKWWGIWCLAIWALSGFRFGMWSSVLFTLVSTVYLVRILRAYYR